MAYSPQQPYTMPYFAQFVLLVLLLLLSFGLFSTLGTFIVALIYGVSDWTSLSGGEIYDSFPPVALMIIQGIGALGGFIAPAVVFAFLSKQGVVGYYGLNKKTNSMLLLLGIAVIFFSQPLIAWSGHLNQYLSFPEWMGGLNSWLEQTNNDVQKGYETLLNISSPFELALLIIVAAIIPAVGEELIFRGAFQRIFTNMTRNGHAGVWIAALIFSLFHFQIYYLLPRLFLGAAIGYLFLWSGNLWYSIWVHFVNNAVLIIIVFFYPGEGQGITEMDQTLLLPIIYTLIMTLVLAITLIIFRKKSKELTEINEQERLGEDFRDKSAT